MTYEELKASGKRFVLIDLGTTRALYAVEKINEKSFETMMSGRVVDLLLPSDVLCLSTEKV